MSSTKASHRKAHQMTSPVLKMGYVQFSAGRPLDIIATNRHQYACSSDDVCQQPCQDVQIPEFVSFITGHCISGFCDCLVSLLPRTLLASIRCSIGSSHYDQFDSDDACKGACSAYYAKKYPDATLLKACRDGRGETCTCKVDCGKADPQCKAMDGEDPSYANCD